MQASAARLAVIFLISALYAIIRYTVVGPEAPDQIPLYILNKAFAMASIVYLLFCAISLRRGQLPQVQFWAKASVNTSWIHVILSAALLAKPYYPRMFGDEKMNFMGELTILTGGLTACCFWLNRRETPPVQRFKLQLLAAFFVAIHIAAKGYQTWLRPGDWYGNLPPISLITFCMSCAALALFAQPKRAAEE